MLKSKHACAFKNGVFFLFVFAWQQIAQCYLCFVPLFFVEVFNINNLKHSAIHKNLAIIRFWWPILTVRASPCKQWPRWYCTVLAVHSFVIPKMLVYYLFHQFILSRVFFVVAFCLSAFFVRWFLPSWFWQFAFCFRGNASSFFVGYGSVI